MTSKQVGDHFPVVLRVALQNPFLGIGIEVEGFERQIAEERRRAGRNYREIAGPISSRPISSRFATHPGHRSGKTLTSGRAVKNYFVYLPAKCPNTIWGCVATSVGFTQIQPGNRYPLQRHPLDHHFDWDHGRVLQAYQIVLISAGCGTFESAAAPGVQKVSQGSVILLFPGVWHRYKPDPETGWVEHWLECRGSAFDAALAAGLIQTTRSLMTFGATSDLLACFERCHFLAEQGALANQDLLSTMGLHMLAMVGRLSRPQRGFEKAIDEVVERAHALLASRCGRPVDLPALAAELGVSYSHLRHSFSARLGVSPKQYYLHARLRKAQELLLNTAKSIKEIADILGFESAFHLSKQFKFRYGSSPRNWREDFRKRQFHARHDAP